MYLASFSLTEAYFSVVPSLFWISYCLNAKWLRDLYLVDVTNPNRCTAHLPDVIFSFFPTHLQLGRMFRLQEPAWSALGSLSDTSAVH